MKFPEYDNQKKYFELCVEYEVKTCNERGKDYEYWSRVLNESNLCDAIKKWESPNHFWYKWHCNNLFIEYKKVTFKDEYNTFTKMNIDQFDDENNWAFITIGFNEQTITDKQMMDVSQRVSELKYFSSCEYVLEKHRENGIHHHTHFLVKFHQKTYRSKLIDWIYQIKGMKNICLQKTFIDILGPINPKKQSQPFQVYYEYIRGNKREEKLKYVAMDDSWREKSGIKKLYQNI